MRDLPLHAWDANRAIGTTDTTLGPSAAARRLASGLLVMAAVSTTRSNTAAAGLSTGPHALPDRASAVLVVVVGLVSMVVGALTGLLGWLSTAWLTVVPAATGSGAYLFPAVCQREPGPGGKRRVVGTEVGEEGLSA
jgi:hypothetical protein